MLTNLPSIDQKSRKYIHSRRASLTRLEGASNPDSRMKYFIAQLRQNIAAEERHRAACGLDPV